MRKSFWIILAVLLVGIGAPNAHADTFIDGSLNFTLTHGTPDPTGGSFVFDYTTDQFTSFSVDWDGNVYNFTSIANTDNYYASLPITGQEWCGVEIGFNGYCYTGGGGSAFFLSFPPAYQMNASIPVFGSDEADGTYNVTCQSATGALIPCPAAPPVPEPASLYLLGSGLLGLVGVAYRRKRWA